MKSNDPVRILSPSVLKEMLITSPECPYFIILFVTSMLIICCSVSKFHKIAVLSIDPVTRKNDIGSKHKQTISAVWPLYVLIRPPLSAFHS